MNIGIFILCELRYRYYEYRYRYRYYIGIGTALVSTNSMLYPVVVEEILEEVL